MVPMTEETAPRGRYQGDRYIGWGRVKATSANAVWVHFAHTPEPIQIALKYIEKGRELGLKEGDFLELDCDGGFVLGKDKSYWRAPAE